ncbi:MAG: CRISPR-associated helicase Cas3' [Phaeodactylibacter sp.]|nr:CRISPR-associated helicase Cas3' [Phaeodactylibacter sp.]
MGYYKTFDEALNAKNFKERSPGQRRVFDAFRAGKHIILKAPTGWGKTFAVTSALEEGHAIYSLPLRVLVDSLAKDVAEGTFPKRVAVQHGARKEHTFLDKGQDLDNPIDLIFTTLDQSLSAFLGIPIGVGYRQGNILPAVIDASHLIFDEFHLLEPQRSMSTALYAIKQSQQNCIILTATLSSTMLEFLEAELSDSPAGKAHGVEVIIGERPFVNPKEIRQGAGFDNIENLPLGEKTIIIRNRIEWAKTTARLLRDSGQDVEVHLLHSELLPDDRTKIEKRAKDIFRKDAPRSGKKQVLVATQVVEAGIDISCDVMHIDLCPPASLIQRVGRSARYQGESATIYWHDVEEGNYSPYAYAKDDINKLRALLQENDRRQLDPELEEQIVEIPRVSDQAFIKFFKTRNPKEETLELRTLRDYEQYRERIRDINSINVAIGTKPNLNYKFLSVAKSKFYGKRFENVPTAFYRFNSETKTNEPVSGEKDNRFVQIADMALLSPEHIGYDPTIGLDESIQGGEGYFLDESQKEQWDYGYRLEPYEAHLQLLHREKSKVRWMIEELAKLQDLGGAGTSSTGHSRELAEGLVDFVIWAHDLGKLTPEWQAAHNVLDPEGISPSEKPLDFFAEGLGLKLLNSKFPIAHSETGGKYARQDGAKIPSHAWISAWAVKDMLFQMVQQSERLFYPVIWTIAEHHGYLRNFSGDLSTKRFEAYEIGYLDYLDSMSEQAPWEEYGWNSSYLKTSLSKEEAKEAHLWFDSHPLQKEHAVSVYYMLSYILRRCDQLATSHVSSATLKAAANSVNQENGFIL